MVYKPNLVNWEDLVKKALQLVFAILGLIIGSYLSIEWLFYNYDSVGRVEVFLLLVVSSLGGIAGGAVLVEMAYWSFNVFFCEN